MNEGPSEAALAYAARYAEARFSDREPPAPRVDLDPEDIDLALKTLAVGFRQMTEGITSRDQDPAETDSVRCTPIERE
jgi:hypothetical protein